MTEQPYYAPQPRRRRWPLILLVLAVAGGGYSYWHGQGDKKQPHGRPNPLVNLASTTRQDIPVYLTGLGTVQAYQTVTVHTQVDGQLIGVRFREGQDVKRGDVLAQVDPRTYQAQYDQAVATKAKDEAQLANAQLDLKRYIKLGNTVTRQSLDTQRATVKQLEATVKADQAAIDSARTSLSYTTITAPISGRTGIRQVDQGNIVHPGDSSGIVVLTQLSPISVIFSLPQQQLEAINAELRHRRLTVDALGADGKTVVDRGILELVDNQIDQTTGTIRLKATLPNRSHQLWPGAFTTARLLLTTQNNALTVPATAVQHGPQGAYVFLYHEKESTVSLQPVEVSLSTDALAVITKGLDDGAQVVVEGMGSLQDGSHVSLPEPKKEKDPAKEAAATADAPTNVASNSLSPEAAAKLSKAKKKRHRNQE